MESHTLCSECELPIKEYKQHTQERPDICENCHIVTLTSNSESEYVE